MPATSITLPEMVLRCVPYTVARVRRAEVLATAPVKTCQSTAWSGHAVDLHESGAGTSLVPCGARPRRSGRGCRDDERRNVERRSGGTLR
jgi:hypothetical protein